MTTLYLNPQTWDIGLDAAGNMALADTPYALAQDAASRVKTFQGDVYYDQTQGLPYLQGILIGKMPLSYARNLMIKAAQQVPCVAKAKVFFSGTTGRVLTGQVQVTDAAGLLAMAGF